MDTYLARDLNALTTGPGVPSSNIRALVFGSLREKDDSVASYIMSSLRLVAIMGCGDSELTSVWSSISSLVQFLPGEPGSA
ncbi:hypothetical protein ACTXT7_010666 [Hymenolepis weldensis]